MTKELHVVDVKRGGVGQRWVVYLSNGNAMYVSGFDHPDELSVYVYVTELINQNEQSYE